jgi:hypothetical protein
MWPGIAVVFPPIVTVTEFAGPSQSCFSTSLEVFDTAKTKINISSRRHIFIFRCAVLHQLILVPRLRRKSGLRGMRGAKDRPLGHYRSLFAPVRPSPDPTLCGPRKQFTGLTARAGSFSLIEWPKR